MTRIIWQWLLSLSGLFTVIGTVHELFTRPNTDVLAESMGAYVSLHSIYLGVLGVGVVLTVPAALAIWRWWVDTHSLKSKFLRLETKLERRASLEVYDIADIRDLRFALAELGIEYPLDGIDARDRQYVTKDLLAACRNGKVKYARTSWQRRGKPD